MHLVGIYILEYNSYMFRHQDAISKECIKTKDRKSNTHFKC